MKVVSDVEDALHQLPTTLFELYSGIMGRIDGIAPRGRLLAMKTLRWLLCARAPLQPSTLVEMLQSSGSDDPLHVEEVLGLCCNLVVLDDSLDLFRFAHASVREYLELQPRFSSQDTNLQAAQECLRQVASIPKASYFTRYARRFWVDHYRALDYQFRIAQPLANEVKSFFIRGIRGDYAFHWWARGVEVDKNLFFILGEVTIRPAVDLAFMYDLLEVMHTMFVSPGIDVDLTYFTDATWLYLAACHGYPDVVEDLLMRSVDPNILTVHQEAVLHRAAESGHEAIALLLLQNNADITVQDDQGLTALDWAVKGDHEAMVRLLILNGSRSEAMQKYGRHLIDWVEGNSSSRAQYDVLSILHRATGCVGIKNEDQTGYVNALLHFLYSILPFHDLLRQASADEDQISVDNALKRLFTEMETSVEIVSTMGLTDALSWGSRQLQELNDAFETFLQLMALFVKHFKKDRVHERFGDSLAIAYKYLFWSEIADLRYPRSEAKLWISVDIKGNETFEQALKQFGKDDDKESPRYGFPRWQLSYSPPVMVFELRRWQYNMHKDGIEKVHDRCTYPANLIIDLTTSQKIPYILHGVIVHRGDSSTGGKIFIYLKSHHTGRWIRCLNELVTWATEEEVFEGNFGSDTKPEGLIISCTAIGLIYIQEDKIGEIARVMVPYSEPQE
ncbi:MAG: hypothetical protein L6R42_008855 [Xanthoria sp. 1 TBL-2021]|nr:MAG: hypothetical protein L6R42_008855 [Xanthoria sp. 1 TBL-2021]